ncbi:cysteine--tRNA ligase [Ranunculus cassubicifolius]
MANLVLFKTYRPLFSSSSSILFYTNHFTNTKIQHLPTLTPQSNNLKFLSKHYCRCLATQSVNNTNPSTQSKEHMKKELWLYNTMSREKELFKPKVSGKVGMYVCGVTAYDFSHIGHARVYVAFDVLFSGNISPIISTRFLRITDNIAKFRKISRDFILDNGSAYSVEGDVYFSVDTFPEYGRLSGRKLEDNRAGERVTVDPRKRNPADFSLWKSAKEGEPFWESPWGPGRPGWHIECSAMSAAYLRHTFDIHGGRADLVFPHHENEIAQSCAACNTSNISYWIHNGFVNNNNEKMSKSLGNFFTIRQAIELYHPLALRLFLMGTHYRSPINYSNAQLESASDRVFYIYQILCFFSYVTVGIALMDGPSGTFWRPIIPLAFQDQGINNTS